MRCSMSVGNTDATCEYVFYMVKPRCDKMEKSCPCCGIIAADQLEIESVFGFRVMNGVKRPQSWCRRCRNHGSLNFHEYCPYKD